MLQLWINMVAFEAGVWMIVEKQATGEGWHVVAWVTADCPHRATPSTAWNRPGGALSSHLFSFWKMPVNQRFLSLDPHHSSPLTKNDKLSVLFFPPHAVHPATLFYWNVAYTSSVLRNGTYFHAHFILNWFLKSDPILTPTFDLIKCIH